VGSVLTQGFLFLLAEQQEREWLCFQLVCESLLHPSLWITKKKKKKKKCFISYVGYLFIILVNHMVVQYNLVHYIEKVI
jgi:hypothetical protein